MKILYTLPQNSLLATSNYDYIDTVITELETQDLDSKDLMHAFIHSTPTWITTLLKIRNKIVSYLGLKTVVLPLKDEYAIGDTVGMFQTYDISPKEVILGEDDTHLNFRISLLLEKNTFALSTVVTYNNTFGKVYFFFIKPFHKIIIKSMAEHISMRLKGLK